MNATAIDHFVLTVSDVAASCEFYESLGAEVVTFGDDRKAVRFGDQKINLHPTDGDVTPVAAEPTVGAGDFCLLTETPIETVEAELRERGSRSRWGRSNARARWRRSRRCTSATPTATSSRSRRPDRPRDGTNERAYPRAVPSDGNELPAV
ncbi:VOC family protein [Halobaculum halobium]|uniref:VOC family protein n=1 Tax=Halobaculum halobium TaxID=3032281 RepID=UPI0036071612